jgi:sulfur carrier protein
MTITINGETRAIDAGATIADVVRSAGVDDDASGMAVAVNETVVPRGEWSTRRLAAGDVIEIIHAVQGG